MRFAAEHLCPDVAATIAELEADPSATTTTLPPGITYEVPGTGTALITYSLGLFDQAQETAALPWRKDFNFMEVSESRQVLAQLQGSGEIICRILRGEGSSGRSAPAATTSSPTAAPDLRATWSVPSRARRSTPQVECRGGLAAAGGAPPPRKA